MWHHSKAQVGQGTAENLQNVQVDVPGTVQAAFGWPAQRTQVMPAQPGFSGASVWKITTQDNVFALKRWPLGQPAYLDLKTIHHLMQQARLAGLHVVPEVQRTIDGDTVVTNSGVLWDACSWQPGQSDLEPSENRMKSAMVLLSRLHALWRSQNERRFGVCPGVMLQYRRLSEWTVDELELLKRKAALTGLFRVALTLFEQYRSHAIQSLTPWLNRRFTLQPCLGDVWADHVLFDGDQVTGLIDFGGARYDHPAQDLARLIGSYTQGNAIQRQLALSYYTPRTDEMEQLSILLDDNGSIVSLGNWLRWLILERRHLPDHSRAISRLHQIVNRLQH
jgi:Ser/Thr protein kinase RdoA (MazF antagonist)